MKKRMKEKKAVMPVKIQESHEAKYLAMDKVFRTIYYIAKENRPLRFFFRCEICKCEMDYTRSPSFVSALADRSNGKPEDTFLGASQLDETKLDNFAASLNTQEIYPICAIKVATY
jgi:hypothetical protein